MTPEERRHMRKDIFRIAEEGFYSKEGQGVLNEALLELPNKDLEDELARYAVDLWERTVFSGRTFLRGNDVLPLMSDDDPHVVPLSEHELILMQETLVHETEMIANQVASIYHILNMQIEKRNRWYGTERELLKVPVNDFHMTFRLASVRSGLGDVADGLSADPRGFNVRTKQEEVLPPKHKLWLFDGWTSVEGMPDSIKPMVELVGSRRAHESLAATVGLTAAAAEEVEQSQVLCFINVAAIRAVATEIVDIDPDDLESLTMDQMVNKYGERHGIIIIIMTPDRRGYSDLYQFHIHEDQTVELLPLTSSSNDEPREGRSTAIDSDNPLIDIVLDTYHEARDNGALHMVDEQILNPLLMTGQSIFNTSADSGVLEEFSKIAMKFMAATSASWDKGPEERLLSVIDFMTTDATLADIGIDLSDMDPDEKESLLDQIRQAEDIDELLKTLDRIRKEWGND